MREVVSSSHNQGAMFKSIPPRSFNYTFTDMVESQLKTRPFQTPKTRLKTAPMRTSTSKEYMERFKSQPLRTPRVVGFEEIEIDSCEDRNVRGVNGFFPPPKLRMTGGNVMMRYSPRSTEVSRESMLALEPKPGDPSPRTGSRKSFTSRCKSCGDVDEVCLPNVLLDDEAQCADLATLPKPKQVAAPNRDAPWVYRYKVKKSMNHLSKIMASKPIHLQQTQDH